MTQIDAQGLDFKQLNDKIRETSDNDIIISNCLGQRYIGDSSSKKNFVINGTPGNALGAYLDGSSIEVNGNAQDAAGDTMNCGTIIVHGRVGDTCGYAMRGGTIYIQESVGYRAGIHMKEFSSFLKKRGFVLKDKVKSLYRRGSYEYFFNVALLNDYNI